MEGFGTGGFIGLIAGIVAITTIVARVLDRLVIYVIEDKRKKNKEEALSARTGGYTTDLAVQRRVMEEVQDDLEKVRDLSREETTALSKDIPHLIAQLLAKHDLTHDNIRELRNAFALLQSALEGNTAATKALYDLLAKNIRPGG